MLARERVVLHLIEQISSAAQDACEADESITADEVFSAYVTITRNVLVVALEKGADTVRLQAIVQQLLLAAMPAPTSKDAPAFPVKGNGTVQ